ncbi:MAG: Flp1 family type IVb pilin [Lachnospiraceae bacterium]|nr:Flp1 family type IVb pilin [Lachnospiraceae bacterium]MDY5556010.1 Flp1 family type IVb pilin [Blautia sp.]
MSDKLTGLWIGARIRLGKFWENFKSEEKGAAEIVAIILVIVVVIAVVVVFREKIIGLINDVFTKTINLDDLKTSPSK